MHTNILLVDDDENILNTLQLILQSEGYNVLTAPTPYKAIQMIQKQDIQLALLNYNLPQMTGTQLAHLINKKKKATKIMFLSGSVEIFEAVKALNFEVFDILAKPINPGQLIETINTAVGRPRLPVKPNLQSNPIVKIHKPDRFSRFFDGGLLRLYTF